MKIEVCIHTFFYQKRLSWMMSSILQQINPPDLLFNVSYLKNDGNPSTDELLDLFEKKGLKIQRLRWDNLEDVRSRAISRNIQLEKSTADWILFVDSDMVYDRNFFNVLNTKLESNEYRNETKCLSSNRVSPVVQYCIDYFNNDKTQYPRIVENVADTVSKWPVWRIIGATRGAGYFQCGNIKNIRENKIAYSNRATRDNWRCCRADKHFRKSLGGIRSIDLPPQYHLNHSREAPIGTIM